MENAVWKRMYCTAHRVVGEAYTLTGGTRGGLSVSGTGGAGGGGYMHF